MGKVKWDRAPQRRKRKNRPRAHLGQSRDVFSLFHGSTKVWHSFVSLSPWPSSAGGSAGQMFCSLSLWSEINGEPCTDFVALELSAKCFAW